MNGINRPDHKPKLEDRFVTRREFLGRCGLGFGMVSLSTLLAPQLAAQAAATDGTSNSPLSPRPPHFPPRAKRVLHIFANGGPSHVDTFDPKPALARLHGKA